MLVGQLGKLSAAAQEMKITQPSMSQRIKNLETELGRSLFVRTSRGVELTSEGQSLYRLLQRPLQQSAERFIEYLQQPESDRVIISVDFAFASFWLLPRLPQLREELGKLDLRIVTSQDPLKISDPEPDISIFMARHDHVPIDAALLFQEQVSAICSPEFLQANPNIDSLEKLVASEAPLLHLNSPTMDTPWIDWADWLRRLGVTLKKPSEKTVFNSYEMVIKAARSGQGVALGWHVLLDDLLARSELVRPFSNTVTTDVGYYIKIEHAAPSARVAEVQNWMIKALN
ncbi:MAG: LysR substrate-binding domain-containing protein [Sneathiella sp.]|nr:LysR substrate-binding domain-containing protein [Sneathiella sp.]MDF2366866.1 LysR substrate-binding domain-containing protein [Sneathiella sp.]